MYQSLSFYPRGKFCVDKLLYSVSSCEPPPEFAALAFQPNSNVKERAARAFERSEFGQGLVVGWVWGKLELKTVGQFPNAQYRGSESFTEVLLALSLFWGEGSTVAKEGSFFLSGGAGLANLAFGRYLRESMASENGDSYGDD
jgi:hypothetical protein